jgi:hypothetical protein
MGGGLGHITRYLAFCNTMKYRPDIITVCEQVANKKINLKGVNCFIPDQKARASKKALKQWLRILLKKLSPQQFFIDAFPGGIVGELCDLPELKLTEISYLARQLKWKTYLKRITGTFPEIKRVYLLETLSENHFAFIKKLNAKISKLTLIDKISDITSVTLPKNYWLVVHSQSGKELHELYNFAIETAKLKKHKPDIVIVCPGKRPEFLDERVIHLDIYPANGLFKKAQYVFSAAGFNTMRQMRNYQDKHFVMPFERALDDQFFRLSSNSSAISF